jgi:SAM-dependent methyltransferase
VTDRWHDYVEGGLRDAGGRLAAAYEDWRYLTPVFDRIRSRLAPGSSILEIGCGAALHAILLSAWGYRVTAGDNDPRIVRIARETVAAFDQDVEVIELDALALPEVSEPYDLAFSLGLVEHFDRTVTVRMLADQARVARRVMVVIPTKHTSHAGGISDERIYSLAQLQAMVREAGMRVEDAFTFGDVPTRASYWMRRLLPPDAYFTVQKRLGYGMNLCVFGRRAR